MKTLLSLALLTCTICTFGQTLFVPGATGSSSTANVGVGTSSPDHLLQIHSGNNPTLSIGKGNTNTTGKSTLLFNAGDATLKNGFFITYNKTATTDRLSFIDGGGVEGMTIANGGNVGIGTSNPGYRFELIKGSGSGQYLTIKRDVLPGNDAYLYEAVTPNYFLIGSNKNGSGTLRKLGFAIGGGDAESDVKMTIQPNGLVGIGTTSPVGKLDINHAGGQIRLSGGTVAGGLWTNNTDLLHLADWASGSKGLSINMSTGTVSVGSSTSAITGYGSQLSFLGAANNGDHLYISRYNNGDNQSEMRVNIGDDYGQAEDKFVVGTNHWNGGWFPHLTVQANGYVGIGTSSPDQALAVKGKIHTQEVNVDLAGAVTPDYVFEKNYNLLPLADLESYITANKHLPEVPSAKEMEADGMNLKEMNLILLKKVEELTLHAIKINKEKEDLESVSKTLVSEVDTLKKQVHALTSLLTENSKK